MSAVSRRRAAYLAETEADSAQAKTPIRTRQIMQALNQVFGHDTIIVHENGGANL